MHLKIPRADAVAFGSLISALIVVVGELHWEHPIKVAAQAVLGFVAAVVVSPVSVGDVAEHLGAIVGASSGSSGAGSIPPPAGAQVRPTPPPEGGQGGEPL